MLVTILEQIMSLVALLVQYLMLHCYQNKLKKDCGKTHTPNLFRSTAMRYQEVFGLCVCKQRAGFMLSSSSSFLCWSSVAEAAWDVGLECFLLRFSTEFVFTEIFLHRIKGKRIVFA